MTAPPKPPRQISLLQPLKTTLRLLISASKRVRNLLQIVTFKWLDKFSVTFQLKTLRIISQTLITDQQTTQNIKQAGDLLRRHWCVFRLGGKVHVPVEEHVIIARVDGVHVEVAAVRVQGEAFLGRAHVEGGVKVVVHAAAASLVTVVALSLVECLTRILLYA